MSKLRATRLRLAAQRMPLLAGLLATTLLSGPMPAAAVSAERARIVAERRQLNAGFDAEERVCRRQFVVSACVEDVRSRRRAALAPLRERELQLDDAERRARAAGRKSAIAAKQQAAAQRASDAASAPPPQVRLRKPAAAASASPHKPHADDSAERAARAAERVQAADKREQAAQDAQQRIAERQAEREKKGKVAAPLPPPPSTSGR